MSEPNHLLRIDHLRLQNFRCFTACELNLHPTLTVLVAENAQGKTALLDALRLALQEFVTTVGRGKQSHGFDRADIHLTRGNQDGMETRLPTAFQVDGEVGGEPVSWRRTLSKDSSHARSSTKDAKEIRRIAKRLPATILAAVAAASASSQFDEQHFIRGAISIIVAVLSGLTTFFNANKRAGSHLDAANKYESLHSEARIFWTIDCRGTASEQVLTTRLKDLSHTKNQLNRQSPQIPGFAYRIAKNGILAGEADYKVDKPVS